MSATDLLPHAATAARLPGRVAVVQPLQGIGDMIWHMPHIAAVARLAETGQVTLITKPTSLADQLLAHDPAIASVFWVERKMRDRRGRHDGPAGLPRLIRELRAARFATAVLLHHSRTMAFALCAAGIRNRYGYGGLLQRPFLNRPPFLDAAALRLHPHEQANAYLAATGWAVASEPVLAVDARAQQRVTKRLDGRPGPIVAVGVGTSEPYKQWGEAKFAALIGHLAVAGWPLVAVIGGPAESALLRRLVDACPVAMLVDSWPLPELGALLQRAEFYVGNDTGTLNLAAAAGCCAYGLFGATAPFTHSSHVVPILPPDGRPALRGGMERITVDAVLQAIDLDRGGVGMGPLPG